MDRISNPTSNKVAFFQHGIFDNSFAFIANGSAYSIGYRAYEQGFDVFMGNFRGNFPRKHTDARYANYWDYTLDDLARFDMTAFIKAVVKTKQKELKEGETVEITYIGHSMGGLVGTMYLIQKGLEGKEHHLSRAILLSPAGVHRGYNLMTHMMRNLTFLIFSATGHSHPLEGIQFVLHPKRGH